MLRYSLLVLFLLIHSAQAKHHHAQGGPEQPAQPGGPAQPAQKWLTLSGNSPLVIARGGFSGLFPESSEFAYQNALATSVQDVVFYCDLQFTKDGTGICQKEIKLNNSTNIADIFPKGQKTYDVNGQSVTGWFAVDFLEKDIFNKVTLTQSILSRPSLFDTSLPILTLGDVQGLKPPSLWLNVPYDMFYKLHNVDVEAFMQKTILAPGIGFVSSPEIGLLKSLTGKVNAAKTKVIFTFLDAKAIEPTTKKPYSAILADLASIKTFASGILVPKEYIWPVNADKYLQPHTTLVADAHKLGLEVYASGFANDLPGSYNYSYDPTAEYLQFIDNSEFSVDGVLTDFPPSASEAVACLAGIKKAKPAPGTLIISHNGASGVYPGSSNLAYQQAITDGADIIDCSVQMSQDGIPFCLNSTDLASGTNAMTTFMTRSKAVPEIQPNNGIFSFNLTWSEIQTLKPQLTSPPGGLPRNPVNKNAGKIISLAEFLDLAKAKAVTGILINIKNAAYLASKAGLSITDAVDSALKNATFDKQLTQQVLIESDDTSVLAKFSTIPNYKKVLTIEETFSDAPKNSVDEIKKFADAVNVNRASLVATMGGFTTSFTKVVDDMHTANISVYVSVLRNEYTSIAFDFFSDPYVEMSTYISGLSVDGIITDYPATANAFRKSPCFDPNANVPYPILPAEAGALLGLIPPDVLPPAAAPAPELVPADVVDPPLPPVQKVSAQTSPAPDGSNNTTDAPKKNGQPANVPNLSPCLVTMLVISFLSLGYYH